MGLWAHPLEPNEIDGMLVPPGKASSLLTDHLIGLNTSLLINSHIAIMTINKSKDQKTSFKEAYMNLLLITGLPLRPEPAQEKWFKSHQPYI